MIGPMVGITNPLASRRLVLRQSDTLLLGFGDTSVRHQTSDIQLNLDLVHGFAHFHPPADPLHRHGVPVGVQGSWRAHRSRESATT